MVNPLCDLSKSLYTNKVNIIEVRTCKSSKTARNLIGETLTEHG